MPHKHTRNATADGSHLAQRQSRSASSLSAWPRPASALLPLAGATDVSSASTASAGARPACAPSADALSADVPPAGALPADTPPAGVPPAGPTSAAAPAELPVAAASAVMVSAWPASPDSVALPSPPPAGCPAAREPRADVIYVPSSGRLNQASAGPFTIPDSRRSTSGPQSAARHVSIRASVHNRSHVLLLACHRGAIRRCRPGRPTRKRTSPIIKAERGTGAAAYRLHMFRHRT